MDARVTSPKRQYFTDAENDVLRAALERLIDSYGTQTHAAKQIGIAQGTVSAFLSKKHGATPDTARKIAQMSGTTVPSLLGWADGGPPTDDPYPNRHVATLMARMAGISERSIVLAREIRLDSATIDCPVLWWFDRIRDFG